MRILAVLSLFSLVLAQDQLEYKLHHRVFHPQKSGKAFDPFGSLLLSRSAGPVGLSAAPPQLILSDSHSSDLHAFAQTLLHDSDSQQELDLESALYQLALEHPGDKDTSQWDVSSVKACHLTDSSSESIIVHVSQDGSPFAIDFFVSPVPRDGSCPKKPSRKTKVQSDNGLDFKPFANTSVIIRGPTYPPLPQLNTPPPLTTEGKLVEPVPEKSFLQKYWVYIAVALLALVFSPAPAEDDQQGGGNQGSTSRK